MAFRSNMNGNGAHGRTSTHKQLIRSKTAHNNNEQKFCLTKKFNNTKRETEEWEIENLGLRTTNPRCVQLGLLNGIKLEKRTDIHLTTCVYGILF